MIVLNEKGYAERCLSSGIPEAGTIYQVLFILAKYYAHTLEFKKPEIIVALQEFVAKHYPRYDTSKEEIDKYIEKYAASAKGSQYHEIDGVWITPKEVKKIEALQYTSLRKLAFTLLCIAKFNNLKNHSNDFWVNEDYKSIFSMANVIVNADARYDLMRSLYLAGFIEFAKGITNLNVRVIVAEQKDTYDKSAGDFCVDDFRTLGYEYLYRVQHENFIRCGECGILVRGNENGTRRYCNKCSGYMPMAFRTIDCTDCGRKIEIISTSRITRCPTCRKDAKKRLLRDRVRRFREREKEVSLASSQMM